MNRQQNVIQTSTSEIKVLIALRPLAYSSNLQGNSEPAEYFSESHSCQLGRQRDFGRGFRH
jgi:hypothetical protein